MTRLVHPGEGDTEQCPLSADTGNVAHLLLLAARCQTKPLTHATGSVGLIKHLPTLSKTCDSPPLKAEYKPLLHYPAITMATSLGAIPWRAA